MTRLALRARRIWAGITRRRGAKLRIDLTCNNPWVLWPTWMEHANDNT